MADERDFRTCGWAGKTKNLEDRWFCNRKKMQFSEADLSIGICPCFDWVKFIPRSKKREKKGSREPGNSLF